MHWVSFYHAEEYEGLGESLQLASVYVKILRERSKTASKALPDYVTLITLQYHKRNTQTLEELGLRNYSSSIFIWASTAAAMASLEVFYIIPTELLRAVREIETRDGCKVAI